MSDERWVTCIHEAGHAVVAMDRGIPPIEIVAGRKSGGLTVCTGGHVKFDSYNSEDGMLIAMAGDVSCEMLLGEVNTASPQDEQISSPHLQLLMSTGQRRAVMNAVVSQVWQIVARLSPQIEALAGELWETPTMSQGELSEVCRCVPELQQYGKLFPKRWQRVTVSSRSQPRAWAGLKPPATMNPGEYLIDRVRQGYGKVSDRAALLRSLEERNG